MGPDAPSGFRFTNSDCNRDICRIVYLADVPNQRRDTTLSPAVSRGFPDVPPGFAPNFDRRVSGRGSLPIYGMWHMVCGKWYRLRGTMWTSVW